MDRLNRECLDEIEERGRLVCKKGKEGVGGRIRGEYGLRVGKKIMDGSD